MPANTALAFFKPGVDVTVHATEALTGKTFARVVAGGRGTLPDGATAQAGGSVLGVVGHDMEQDGHVHVHVGGVVPVTAGDDITAGTNIAVGANGQAAPAGDTDKVVGYAVANASSGADVPVLLK